MMAVEVVVELSAGVARRVINPPIGMERPGIRLFADPIQAIESDLTATVLVLSADDRRLAMVACDLCAVARTTVERIRQVVAQRVGTDPSQVLFNESHTHSGPALPGFTPATGAQAALESAYQADLLRWAEEAATEAAAALRPARIGAGWGECAIGAYRRERRSDGSYHLAEVPDAPTDPAVGVVRVDHHDGTPIAIVFSYGCHPVTMGPHSHVASSDYPGAARAVVEGTLGGTAMFLQACGGNINPITGIGAEVDCRDNKNRIGAMLGGEVVKVAAGIRTNVTRGERQPIDTLASISVWPWQPVAGDSCQRFAVGERTVALDYVELPSLAKATAIQERWHGQLEQALAGGHRWDLSIAKKFAHWADVLVAAVERGDPTLDVAVQAIRVNDIALVAVGAELFFETGIAVRAASPVAHTQVIGYSNACLSYLPRAEDYPEGGWDVDTQYAVPDLFFQSYNLPVALDPGSEARIVAAAEELLTAIGA